VVDWLFALCITPSQAQSVAPERMLARRVGSAARQRRMPTASAADDAGPVTLQLSGTLRTNQEEPL